MGTITFSGHGGDTVMSGFDDMMPTAYEEVFAITKNKSDAATGAGNLTIAGIAGDNLWRYDSPSVGGAQFSVAYQSANGTGHISSYSDMGIKVSPEMVEGLTVGYAEDDNGKKGTAKIETDTMYAKYAFGSFTVGVQSSEQDGGNSNDDDEFSAHGITYQVNDDFTIGYHASERQMGDKTADQETKSVQASYTMGGVTLKAQSVSMDNAGGST